jgi:hypothetical protein
VSFALQKTPTNATFLLTREREREREREEKRKDKREREERK